MTVKTLTKDNMKSLSLDEQRLFRRYGKLPSQSSHLAKRPKEHKYFDSGDYALSNAGKAGLVDSGVMGSQHPLPENIPHLSSPGLGNASHGGSGNSNIDPGVAGGSKSGSPIKESSFLKREVDELDKDKGRQKVNDDFSRRPAKD